MKKIIYISFIIIILFNCKKKETKILQKFTEKDAYEIINQYIVKLKEEQKNNGDDTIIYWSKRQLLNPPYAYTFFGQDTLVEISESHFPYPRFTKGQWKIDKIKNIIPVGDEEYKIYTNGLIPSSKLDKLWKLKYNSNVFHNVSYPIYNPKSKNAVIKDKIFEPFTYCGGNGTKSIYTYKKEKGKWCIINSQ